MICGNCDKTDGLVYTSLPPKVRCKISKRFHETGDECDIEWKPVVHAHWFTTATGWIYCSNCDREPPNETNYKSDYCPNCGAKMDGGKR